MSVGMLNIGMSGINAAQVALSTTSHNIANASTSGYNRQRIGQTSSDPIATGSGFVGQGTTVTTVTRIYSSYIANQVNQFQTAASQYSTYYGQISQINNTLADSSAGLSPALSSLFTAMQQVASDASLVSARQSMASGAQTLVSRFQSLQSQLQGLYDGVNTQLQNTVSSINAYASQIAQLNQQIIVAQASTNQPANDLLDKRDQLVSDLNKLVGTTTVVDSSGAMNVFIGTGQQLVVGTSSQTLDARPSASDPQRYTVGILANKSYLELPEDLLSGGALAGLMSFRSESLDSAANTLGQIATSVALTFNAQQSLGQDMLGNTATSSSFAKNIFNYAQPQAWANGGNTGGGTLSATFTNPTLELNNGAFQMDYAGGNYTITRKSDGSQWTGTSLNSVMQSVYTATGTSLDMTTGNYATKLTGSDYTVSYDGTNYAVTRASDGKRWTDTSLSNLSSTVSKSEGFAFSLSAGTMNAGDSFLVQPTRYAAANISVNSAIAADPRLIAAAAPLATAATTTNTGSGTISAGSVSAGYTVPSSTLTMSYNGGNLTFDAGNLPATVTVTTSSGTQTITLNTTTDTIPYTNPSTSYTVNGMTFSLSGSPANGDSFTIGQNTKGTSDSRNITLLNKLQTQGTTQSGDASFADTYAQLVSQIGNQTRTANTIQKTQQSLTDQASATLQSQSGVNLDEEATNLIKYQQAYQASAKVIQIASQLFNTVLQISS